MVSAIGPRHRSVIAGLAMGCLLMAAAAAAEEPAGRRETGEPALLDRSVWFSRYLADHAESPAELPDDDGDQESPVQPRGERMDEPAPLSLDQPPLPDPFFPTEPILPTAPIPPPPGRDSTDESLFTVLRRSRSRASFARRRRPIAVLGDSLVDGGQMDVKFTVMDYTTWPATPAMASATTDIPLIATAARTKVAENSSVIPMDRLIVSYQHFQNGRSAEISHPVAGRAQRVLDLDRMTIGFEKTLFGGQSSFDVRLPVTSRFDASTTDFTMTNGRLGNASLLFKNLLYDTDAVAFGLGVGIDMPTGSDAEIMLPNSKAVISNDAFHALPYLGLLVAPSDTFVLQAFAQVDIPLNGNQIEAFAPSGGSSLGQFDEQELLFLSLSAARWHYQNPDAAYLRGLAALLELHYTTSLDDSDLVTVSAAGDTYALSNPANRFSNLNLTAGVQAVIGMTSIRTAAVLPLQSGARRPFDAEFLLQINRYY